MPTSSAHRRTRPARTVRLEGEAPDRVVNGTMLLPGLGSTELQTQRLAITRRPTVERPTTAINRLAWTTYCQNVGARTIASPLNATPTVTTPITVPMMWNSESRSATDPRRAAVKALSSQSSCSKAMAWTHSWVTPETSSICPAGVRNKQLITLNLRTKRGAAIMKQICAQFDVVIENLRPGTLEKWSLGFEQLSARDPGLILARIPGFGQTGPYVRRPGYAAVGQATGRRTGRPGRGRGRTPGLRPWSAVALTSRSSFPPDRQAAKTPAGMANASVISGARNASSMPTGRRSASTSVTDWLVRRDVPRSPVNRWPSHRNYCTKGWSSPSCWWMAATCSSVAF